MNQSKLNAVLIVLSYPCLMWVLRNRIGRRGQAPQPRNGASPAGAPRRPTFGFGRKQAAAEEEEAEEEDASYNPAEALRGLFGSAKVSCSWA